MSGRARGLWPVLQRIGLWAASVPYGWAAGLRNWMYDRAWNRLHRAAVPVISIGNLTLGGTGKTPCVEYAARFFRTLELRVAILSRGYGGQGGRNDEALVLERNLPDVPHLQGPDRALLADIAVEELESEVLILDDGFQHRQLARDLDLVLVDASRPWGHGHLFPRGLLREPPRSLRRAGMVLLTRADQVDEAKRRRIIGDIARHAPGVSVAESVHRPAEWVNSEGQSAPLDMVRQQPAAAFCGIGNPDAFRHTLQSLGAGVAAFREFPDHHPYARADVDDLRAWARRQPESAVVVTTQKDLVKVGVPQLGGRPLWALRIELSVEVGEEMLQRKLKEAIREQRS